MANQREHLILLVANVHIRQLSKPDQQPKVLILLGSYISTVFFFFPFAVNLLYMAFCIVG